MSEDTMPKENQSEQGTNPAEEIFVLDLERRVVPMQLKDGNTVRNYVLKELMGDDRDKFLNVLGQRTKVTTAGQIAGLKSYDGIQAELIHKCMFDDADKPVQIGTIKSWTARVQNAIFKKCQQISGLTDDAEEKAKNG